MTIHHLHPAATPAEVWAFERARYTAPEIAKLAVRKAEASAKLTAAVTTMNFAQLHSAYLDLAEIADQTAQLNSGLLTVIESTIRRSAKTSRRAARRAVTVEIV